MDGKDTGEKFVNRLKAAKNCQIFPFVNRLALLTKSVDSSVDKKMTLYSYKYTIVNNVNRNILFFIFYRLRKIG